MRCYSIVALRLRRVRDLASLGGITYRQQHEYSCAFLVGVDVQLTAELTDSFAHSAQSDTRALAGGDFRLDFLGNTPAGVFALECYFMGRAVNANVGAAASGVTMDVGQRFLNHAEKG